MPRASPTITAMPMSSTRSGLVGDVGSDAGVTSTAVGVVASGVDFAGLWPCAVVGWGDR